MQHASVLGLNDLKTGVNTQALRHLTQWGSSPRLISTIFMSQRNGPGVLRGIMEFEIMNATTKFGIALMVLALFVLQPFSKCFGAPPSAMSHHCCPAPSKAECKMASCVCESTPSTTALVPVVSFDSAPLLAVLVSATGDELTVPFRSAPEPEHFRVALNDRFLVLHQFLI